MTVPVQGKIKIYHIVHTEKLPHILAEKHLVSDAEVRKRDAVGLTIGMQKIKDRRLGLPLRSRPGLFVGQCVPFYFCPRSPMLYMIHKGNHPDLGYRGGQGPVIHLVADFFATVGWAEKNGLRWALTDSNAGSCYFGDYSDLGSLDKIDWGAVGAIDWRGRQDHKMAEFLIEQRFPWELVEMIGASSQGTADEVKAMLATEAHIPLVEAQAGWYYGGAGAM